ncbi:MAG: hypothetical protein HRU40_14785, partial [Saprospiraceae bacterium]|nr:hypothetical protein [Saprospiraceae bacterium]
MRFILTILGILISILVAQTQTLHIIESGNFYFNPSSLTIEVGDTVQWLNRGGFHNVDAETNAITGQPFNNPESFVSSPTTGAILLTRVFTVAGSYQYNCSVGSHASNGMAALLIVTEQTDCPNTLSLSGTINSGDYIAGLTLVSDGTVATDSDVLFQAGQTITLQAGFTVAAGASFHAVIDDCTSPSPREEVTNEIILPEVTTPVSASVSGLRAGVYPNPLRYNGQIVLELTQNEEVSIQVYDQSGRLVR